MSNILDAILRKELYGTRDESGTNYLTINSDGNSDSDDISGSEQGGLIAFSYENGVANNVDFVVQGSEDGVVFADFASTDAQTSITDASGEIIYDLTSVNANFIRLKWTVNAGTMDIYVRSSFKRRH